KEVYEYLHRLRRNEKQFEEALEYHLKSIALEKEIQSIEAKKQAERFDSERKIAEREKQFAFEQGRLLERESILRNILPDSVTDRLVKGENPIADHFETASVLFMDLVGFTTLASIAPPKQLVYLLDAIFQKADEVVEQFGLEKIKTIGDGYLAVANITTPLENHQHLTALAALQLLETMKEFTVNIPSDLGDTNWIKDMNDIEIRIGIHTGEVVAGIIGKNKYTYDLWGDAVNVASRMESNSEAGRIHISDEFAKSIETYPEFTLIPRGEISIKGKGTMKTFWLEKGK
ncbi:MAG: adenylate/guanylate cyclase domain-containing protein, partial [Candidatus Kapabacteria bacterium]|nr:adenylate/guanylate cyclase domain-containing protein [Candidatus Kapabacteria bacterium]